MDAEIKELMDKIMENMHLISWWMKELQKQEMGYEQEVIGQEEPVVVAPKKIKREFILDNVALNNLFIKSQIQYRKLAKLIARKVEEEKEHYKNSDSFAVYDKIVGDIIKETKNYLTSSYAGVKFVSHSVNGKKVVGIYEYSPDQFIAETEARLQMENLDMVMIRLRSNLQPNTISFSDKPAIISHIALNDLYSYYVFDRLDSYMDNCEKNKDSVDEDAYEFERLNIIRQKYMHYYEALNHKYNGFIQENDFGKFLKAKQAIALEGECSLLNMSEYEYLANVSPFLNELKEEFEGCMELIVHNASKVASLKKSYNRIIKKTNLDDLDDRDDR